MRAGSVPEDEDLGVDECYTRIPPSPQCVDTTGQVAFSVPLITLLTAYHSRCRCLYCFCSETVTSERRVVHPISISTALSEVRYR